VLLLGRLSLLRVLCVEVCPWKQRITSLSSKKEQQQQQHICPRQ
jgi:hypothetical protein